MDLNIKGAIIKTASTGARFEIDQDGVRRYNAENKQVTLDGTAILEGKNYAEDHVVLGED